MDEYHFYATYSNPETCKMRTTMFEVHASDERSAFEECVKLAFGSKQSYEGVFKITLAVII